MKTRNKTSLCVEQLEDRLVQAASINLTAAGVLQIQADGANDLIRVTQTSTRVDIQGAQFGYKASAVRSIVIDGGGGNDLIDLQGVSLPCTVYGGAGHDTIYGGQNADTIYGGDGDDRIFGLGGNDFLYGNNHDDRIFGGTGYDSIYGGFGTDFMDDGSRTAHEFYAAENDGAVDYIADMITPSTGASMFHVKQGSSNLTCWYLATLSGMANAGVNMNAYVTYAGYTGEGVGIYYVKLYTGTAWITSRVYFEGHTTSADAQPTADFASWTIIMSRAWRQTFGNRGGLPHSAMIGLGHRPVTSSTFTGATFNAIGTNLSRGFAVVAGTAGSTMAALENGHAYQVVRTGYINGVACVLLYNPWGYDGGRGNDGNTSDGLIWITWSQFTQNMNYLAVG